MLPVTSCHQQSRNVCACGSFSNGSCDTRGMDSMHLCTSNGCENGFSRWRMNWALRYRIETKQHQESFTGCYGRKLFPRHYNENFNALLLKHGFSRSMGDCWLYTSTNKDDQVEFALYVDDLPIVGKNSTHSRTQRTIIIGRPWSAMFDTWRTLPSSVFCSSAMSPNIAQVTIPLLIYFVWFLLVCYYSRIQHS